MGATIAERLKELRVSAGLTQAEVAGQLHITREAYSMYERNKRQPNYDSLHRIADFYQINLDYLFGRSERRALPKQYAPEEELLLKRFRRLTDDQKDLILEQEELYLRHNMKKTQTSSTGSSEKPVNRDA